MKLVSKEQLVLRFKAPGWKEQYAMFGDDRVFLGDTLEYLEALRRARLYIPDGHSESERVARTFQLVWLSLPVRVRTRLMTYWKANLGGVLPGVPIIEIADNYFATASTSGGGQIGFNGLVIAQMDDTILKDVVAHEIGHAWNYTFADSFVSQQLGAAAWVVVEWEADLAANYWGTIGPIPFDMTRMRKWGDANDKLIQKITGRSGMWILPALNTLKVQPIDPRTRD